MSSGLERIVMRDDGTTSPLRFVRARATLTAPPSRPCYRLRRSVSRLVTPYLEGGGVAEIGPGARGPGRVT